jgi:UDP-4-amino-4,6-dideoxy-N-acetyl-beta-L-altrosamine transaminase
MIPYGRQYIDDEDIQAVIEVLRSDWLTQGPKVKEFEETLAQYCGAQYAVAVSSGTAALHLAYRAAGICEGDEVITTPITFAASANAVAFCGGKPVFADIDEKTFNIDVREIERKITSGTKALLSVHFAGLPCDMQAISALAKEHGLIVIEDACHALGAKYRGQGSGVKGQEKIKKNDEWIKIGSCEHSDMTLFSFHPVKHITTGEGGAILTNNKEYYEKLLKLRSHGITKDQSQFTALDGQPAGMWYYEMQELGYNYRLTDIQCALGLSQLKKLDMFVNKRRALVEIYNKSFKNLPHIEIPYEPVLCESSYHLYVLRVSFDKLGKTRKQVVEELQLKGVGTQVHYIPVHMQPYYKNIYHYREGDLPVAESYYKKALSLPLYFAMTDDDIEKVINSVMECLNVK